MASFLLTILTISIASNALVPSHAKVIRVGGIFEDRHHTQELAFLTAIKMINDDHQILPDVELVAQVERIQTEDSLQAYKKACRLLSMGVAGLVGPQSKYVASLVQSISDAMQVPYIATNWNPPSSPASINLQPYLPSIIEYQQDLVRHWGWTSFAILYEYTGDLMQLTHFMHYSDKSPRNPKLWQLPIHQYDFSRVLISIMAHGYTNIIIDCQTYKVARILKQAQQLGMITGKYHYFINALDVDFLDWTDFQFSGATIMSIRFLDLSKLESATRIATQMNFTSDPVDFDHQSALLMDGINLLARGLAMARIKETSSLSCDIEGPWQDGAQVINAIKSSSVQGFTGDVTINPAGQRSQFDLDIIQLHPKGLSKVGSWNKNSPDPKTNILTIAPIKLDDDMPETLELRTLRVATILSPPYVQQNGEQGWLEGFCVDLLEELSKHLGFRYTISLEKNNTYGRKDKGTGKWNGVIGELVNKKADLAIGDLTTTHSRAEVVEFSVPFLHVGITALVPDPGSRPLKPITFWSPFSLHLWWYIFGAYIATSVLLFVLARFLQWEKPHPCVKDPQFQYNDLDIKNSLWFTLGSFMMQGSNLTPKSISTRIVAAAWWFFAIFVVAIYTAKMMSSASIRDQTQFIKDEWELITHTQMKFGCINGGSTKAFFENSDIPVYQQVFARMAGSDPSGFVSSFSEGLARVKQGNFAFFVESSTADYLVERDCELYRIDSILDNKGYAIMFPIGSPFREKFSSAILKLQESHTIRRLQDRWWKHKRSLGHCSEIQEDEMLQQLQWNATNFRELFIILLVGVVLAYLIAIGEFALHIRQIHPSQRGSFGQELFRRLKFVVSNEAYRIQKPIEEVASETDQELPSIS